MLNRISMNYQQTLINKLRNQIIKLMKLNQILKNNNIKHKYNLKLWIFKFRIKQNKTNEENKI